MSDTQEVLSKLKVPELKAKCKLLKIPNYSKLSKTELIARILAADHTQSLLTPTTVTAATPNDGQDGGREQDGGKTQGEVKERKGGNPRPISSKGDTLPTTAPTSTPTPKLTPAGDVIDAIAQVESTSAIISQNEQQGQNQTSHSQPSATKAKDGKEKKGGGTGRKRKSPGGEEGSLSATTTGVNDETPRVPVPKLAKKVTKPVPKPPQPTQRVPSSAPPPTGNSSTSSATPPPTGTTTGTFGARTSVSQVSSITGDLDMVTSVIKPSKPNPIVLPKSTPKAGITKLKSKSTQPRPEFKPLTIVRPTQTPAPLPPTIPETKIPLDSPTDRLTYLEGHFLNTVSIHLHSNRIKPILAPPYPTPTPYPTSSITSHLAFQGLDPSLYTSHTPEEFEVGLRFWIARLHTSLQLGSGDAWSAKAGGMGVMGPDMADWPPIIDCHRIVGDIWKIKTLGNGEEVAFIVVGCIGEVTGHSRVRTVDPKDPNEEELGLVEVEVEGCRVRSDWAGYINNGAKTDVGSLVKSKDSYNFPGGISKTWLARAGVGRSAIDVRIAERSVLASCALNSFSGEKLSAITMDAAWLGRPSITPDNTLGKVGLDIYLPESSQVLSVHRPRDIHPALAIIHRVSGYSEYVLADTGQIVGTEDEGVVPLWQSLLGCNEKGVVDDSSLKQFWKGWESRMKAG